MNYFAELINLIITHVYFLLRLKQTEVIFIPVSLLSCLGNVAEAVLLLRLQKFVDSESLIPAY
jgi:hypothetical protein